MKALDIFNRSGRSLRQAKIRTLLTALAIGVGAFALTLTLAASNGAQAYVNKIIHDNFDPAELIVTNDPSVLGGGRSASKPQQYDPSFGSVNNQAGVPVQVKQLTDGDIKKIKAVPGVEQVREAVSPQLQYIAGPNGKKYVATAYTFSPAQKPDLLAGKVKNNLGHNQLLLPAGYVSVLGFRSSQAAIHQPINVAVQKAFNLSEVQSALAKASATGESAGQAAADNVENVTFTVAGVYKAPVTSQPGTENILYIGLTDTKALSDYATANTPSYHKYLYAYARIHNGNNSAQLAVAQSKIKKLGYQAQSVKDTQQFLNQIIAVLRGIVITFGLIALVASVFGIVNTMYISVLQRTREIGLMKALGMHRRAISWLFRIEAAWIGFLGGISGSLAAVGLGTALNPLITRKLQLGSGNRLLIFEPSQLAILVGLLIFVAIVAGLLPARKAAKLDPIEALRTE